MTSYRIIKGSIWDSPWFETKYNAPELLVDCPEHEKAGDDGVFPNCPNCRHRTIETALSRAQDASLDILRQEKLGLPVPESWRKAAADLPAWQTLFDSLPPINADVAGPVESDPAALPSIFHTESGQN